MKLKVLAILTAIILIVTYVPVYADTPVPNPPTDAWEYWVICDDNQGGIYCFSSHNPITVTVGKYVNLILNTGKLHKYDNGNWELTYEKGYDSWIGNFETMYASNHDIAYEDGSGFFFECPKVSPLIQTMEVTDFGTILRTFSDGLIPVLGLLILAISLAKAWGFLRTQLKH